MGDTITVPPPRQFSTEGWPGGLPVEKVCSLLRLAFDQRKVRAEHH